MEKLMKQKRIIDFFRRREFYLFLAVIFAIAAFQTDAAAQTGKTVPALLDELAVEYSLEDGLYFVPVELDGDRRQIVVVDPELLRVEGEKPFRSVSSFAFSVKGKVPADLKTQVDELISHDSGWALTEDGGENILIYTGIADEDVTAEEFGRILISIAIEADAVEKKLTGKDEY
jgi:hypothetical protein